MSRTIDRSVARRLYTKFSKLWRADLRTAGLYGKAKSPRRPTFNQWYSMHMGNNDLMKESTPRDVAEYLQPMIDPWMEALPIEKAAEPVEERGVVTMNIAGDDE